MNLTTRSRAGRDFVARHGETVFNAARVLQGEAVHTPLTRAGFAQADAIGRALRELLGDRPSLALWCSPAGRALQTMAIVVEHLDLDWRTVRFDPRLVEIDVGSWGGRAYPELEAEIGPVVLPRGLLGPAPDGEDYPAVARRLSSWLDDTHGDAGDRLIAMHGISSRVMRGMMTGLADDPTHGAPIVDGLPQGSVALIADGRETVAHLGAGRAPAS